MAFLHILGIILKVLGFTVLGVLGLALLILLFLLLIPIGADFEYIGGEYKLSAKACGILIQLLPKKEKKEKKPKEKKERRKKEKKPKKEKEGGEEKPKEKKALDLSKEEIFELIKKVLGSLKKFGQLTVDRFMLHYTAAGKDPGKSSAGSRSTASCCTTRRRGRIRPTRRRPSPTSTPRSARSSRSARASSASRTTTCGRTATSRPTG